MIMDQEKRDYYGREVRNVWIDFAKKQGDEKPGHLLEWDELDEANKEVDRRIGEHIVELATHEYAHLCGLVEEYTNLLTEAEVLLQTAPISGSSTLSNPKWRAWTEQRKVWLSKMARAVIHEALREVIN